MISYEDFKQVEVRAGKILAAAKIPETDKLLQLSVDLGEPSPRTIVSGIALHFPGPSLLVGKTAMFVANLAPRVIRGVESHGMLFAVSTPATADQPEGAFSLLEPNQSISPGTLAA